jgi:PP-loop superfamily ATP-utilizing enzyme
VKRKRIPAPRPAPDLIEEPVVPEKLLEDAKRSIEADRLRHKTLLCTVCASECAPNSTEGLCWVCRRLKLSAWRDSDSQMPAQE